MKEEIQELKEKINFYTELVEKLHYRVNSLESTVNFFNMVIKDMEKNSKYQLEMTNNILLKVSGKNNDYTN